MKAYTKWGVLLYILFTYPVWGAVETSKPASTSDDYLGLNNNLTTFGGTWLGGTDSTYPGAGIAGYVGMSGGYSYTRAIRFPSIDIPQGATIDSVEWWVRSGCNACTDTIELRGAVYDADNGIQVTDTAGFRTAWASRATSTGSIDTGYLGTVTSWGLGSYVRLPLYQMDSAVQVAISRGGWTSGNALTLFCVATAASPQNRRATRMIDYSASTYDSLWISYSTTPGGGGGATPNTVIRGATVRSVILRAPDKLFRHEETWKW
jgi:hypothetical protein